MKQLIENLKKSKETKGKINVEIPSPYGDPIDVDEEEEVEGGDVVARSVFVFRLRVERKVQIFKIILLQDQLLGLNPP